MFGKMDCYCVVKFAGMKKKTKVSNGTGKNPMWFDHLDFPMKNDDGASNVLEIEVWDEDNLSSDLVGKGACTR